MSHSCVQHALQSVFSHLQSGPTRDHLNGSGNGLVPPAPAPTTKLKC